MMFIAQAMIKTEERVILDVSPVGTMLLLLPENLHTGGTAAVRRVQSFRLMIGAGALFGSSPNVYQAKITCSKPSQVATLQLR